MRRIAVLDAPSNLGLRPPTATSVPGCAKAPGALRDHGLLPRLRARDAGCLTPPRYDPGDWRPGDGVCHAPAIAAYSRALADRIGAIIDLGEFPVVLGGDCSIVLGSALAMHRLGEAVGGRIGLVFVDGHSDFRHPGNASYVGAAAGEDLALATGRGQADLAAIEGRRPYYRDIDVVVMGIRGHDEYRLDLQAAGIVTRPVPTLRAEGAARSAQWARDQLVDCAGYWVHVDVDVLDPAVMPAVDAPEPGGIAFPELELLLAGLVDTPHCLGVEITVFDPDYDTDGSYAEEITSTLVAGLAPVSTSDAPTPTDRTQVRARDDADAAAEVAAAAVHSVPAAPGVPAEPNVPAASGVPAAREGGLRARDGGDDGAENMDVLADRGVQQGRLRVAGLLGEGLPRDDFPRGGLARDGLPRDGFSGDGAVRDGAARDAADRDAAALGGDVRGGDVRGGDVRDGDVRDGAARDDAVRDGELRPGGLRTGGLRSGGLRRGGLDDIGLGDGGLRSGSRRDAARKGGLRAAGLGPGGLGPVGRLAPPVAPERVAPEPVEREPVEPEPSGATGRSGVLAFPAGLLGSPTSGSSTSVGSPSGGPVGGSMGSSSMGGSPTEAASGVDSPAVDADRHPVEDGEPVAQFGAADGLEPGDEEGSGWVDEFAGLDDEDADVESGQPGPEHSEPMNSERGHSGQMDSEPQGSEQGVSELEHSEQQYFEPGYSAVADSNFVDAESDEPAGSTAEQQEAAERQAAQQEAAQQHQPEQHQLDHDDHDDHDDHEQHTVERPLGSAPLLDSEPLPATMPGMLRPRPIDAFTLPVQRPAFDAGPEHPPT